MTGTELFSLIQGLADINEKMARIANMDDFQLQNDYTISGYDVEKIANICWKAKDLINKTSFKPE